MSSSMTTPSPRVRGWNEAEEWWWAEMNPLSAASPLLLFLRRRVCVLWKWFSVVGKSRFVRKHRVGSQCHYFDLLHSLTSYCLITRPSWIRLANWRQPSTLSIYSGNGECCVQFRYAIILLMCNWPFDKEKKKNSSSCLSLYNIWTTCLHSQTLQQSWEHAHLLSVYPHNLVQQAFLAERWFRGLFTRAS